MDALCGNFLSELGDDLLLVHDQVLLLGYFVFVEVFEGLLVGMGQGGEFSLETLLFVDELLVEGLKFLVEVVDMGVFECELVLVVLAHL